MRRYLLCHSSLRTRLSAALLLVNLGACTGIDRAPDAITQDAQSADPLNRDRLDAGVLPAGTAGAIMHLYVFDCGRIELDDVAAFGLSNQQTPVRKLFVPCYLIDHPAGRLLFDLGLPPAIAGQGRVEYGPGSYMQQDRSLVAQLEEIGLKPKDIDLISISHGHFDHVGAANLFPEATVVLQRAEYEAAFEHAEDYEVYTPDLYANIRDSEFKLLDGDHDLFGDGQVRFISTPGHTPGHQALLLNLRDYGPLLLSGDLFHFLQSRVLQTVPLFNTDREQTLASMSRIEKLLQDTGATLWIEHNLVLAESLVLAPGYYQ